MTTRRKLLARIDQDRVRTAIEEAERRTSGEIVVSVSPLFWGSVRRTAEKAFDRLGVAKTADRNGILFFIVPARRRFAVLGDVGIHEKVGQDFWEAVAAAMSERFRDGDFSGGLVEGIREVGERLAEHFPYDSETDVNELPNAIDVGGEDSGPAPGSAG